MMYEKSYFCMIHLMHTITVLQSFNNKHPSVNQPKLKMAREEKQHVFFSTNL